MVVPKIGRGRGRGRPSKELESVGSPFRCNIGGGTSPEISQGLKSAIMSVQEIDDRISSTSTVTWNPFTVFPKEIYLKIFGMLDDPNDKENFLNAHIKFYDLFKQDRPLFLFGNVLKILAKHGNGIEREKVRQAYERRVNYFNNECDSNGLSDGDYLNLRLVCRDWDAAFQDYLQLHPSHFRLGGNKWEEKFNSSLGMRIPIFEREWIFRKQFGDEFGPRSVFKVLENIKMTHPPSKNPFLTRNFRFKVGPYIHPEVDHDLKVNELLETYGHHIWHCNFVFAKVTRETFSQFLKWLTLMPELKTLEMCGDEYEQLCSLRNSGNIKLPEMAKLSVIKCQHFPPDYFNKLLEGIKGPLEKVRIDLGHKVSLKEYQLPSSLIEILWRIEEYAMLDHIKMFQNYSHLRKLSLSVKTSRFSRGDRDWAVICYSVEEMFPQLEELNLELPEVIDNTDQDFQRQGLSLPKLKKLRVVLPNLASLDFLLPLKELEEIQIIIEHPEWVSDKAIDLAEKEVIKFNMNFYNMRESNIWQVLPKLRKLHIKAVGQPFQSNRPIIRTLEEEDEIPTPLFYVSVEEQLPWHLYGYVKNGNIQKFISYIPRYVPHSSDERRRFEIVHKLFYMSHSDM